LDKAERFVKLLTEMPAYELRIHVMNFLEEFDEQTKRLNEPLEIYSKCSIALLNSDSLKEFIGNVLATGNFINMVYEFQMSLNFLGQALLIFHIVLLE
jgi:hypothetical protein